MHSVMNSSNYTYDIVAVVPTINRPDELGKCIECIWRQTRKPDAVIIVDQSDIPEVKSTVDSLESKFRNSSVRYFYIHDRTISGLTAARQRAVDELRANFYVFVDDDVFVDSSFIENLVATLNEYPNYGGVSGIDTSNVSRGWLANVPYRLFRIGPYAEPRRHITIDRISFGSRVHEVNVIHGGMTAYRGEVFGSFSFDENLIGYCLGEDIDFSYRVSSKWRVGIVPSAKAKHTYSEINRYSPFDSFESRVASAFYLYKKNFKGKKAARYALFLYVSAIFAQAIRDSVVHRNITPLTGYMSGVKKVVAGFKDVKFIRNSPFC